MTNANPPAKESTGFDARIAQQQAVVDKLAEDHAKKPSAEIKAQLDRKSDALLHLKNLAKGDPKGRAKKAAQIARLTTLSKAITQPLKMP